MKKLILLCAMLMLVGCAAPIKVQPYSVEKDLRIETFDSHRTGEVSQAYGGKILAGTKMVKVPVGDQAIAWSESRAVFVEHSQGISANPGENYTCTSITPNVSPVATVDLDNARHFVVPLKCPPNNPLVILVNQKTKRVYPGV